MQGGVLAQPGGPRHLGRQLLQLTPGVGGIGDYADVPAGQRPASDSAMRRASRSLDAEFVSLITSLASTGMATGLLIIGSRTTIVILSFRVSQGCDLRCPVVDSVADGTLAA